MGNVYARDLKSELLNDVFMGKGFEKKLKEADEKSVELIVGKYNRIAELEE